MAMFESNNTTNASGRAQAALERAKNGELDLRGAQIEFAGRKLICVEGQLLSLNPSTLEVRGQVKIVSATRPSVLCGAVKLRAQGLDFELSMICVREAGPGELLVKFLGRYHTQSVQLNIQA